MDCSAFRSLLSQFESGAWSPEVRMRFEAHAATCADCARTFDGYVRSTCVWMTDFILDYIEETLEHEQRRVFDWHLSVCRECRDYLEQYRATVAATHALRAARLPLPPRLLAAILAVRKP